MFMKQRVKQLAITERSVKMKKIVAVVIIMFIFSIIILGEGSKLVFQKICERRETAWPDLGTADDEQYEWLATVYKGNIIKNLIMDCQSYTQYRPNETTGGIFVSWRRKEELPTGA